MKSTPFRVLTTLTSLALLPAAALAEPTIYGKANVSIQNSDVASESALELVSNASRIGLKGSEELENGMKAIYKFEYETYIDDGDNGGRTFGQRNIYVGLSGDFGTVKGGMFDSPLKTTQNKVDLFNDLAGDIKNLITVNDNRTRNTVSYTSPKGPVVGQVAVVMSEDPDVNNGLSASLTYSNDSLYIAAAMDQDVEGEDTSAVRAVAQYTVGDLQVGLLGESSEDATGESDSGMVGSVQYKIEQWALKAQVGQSDILAEGGQYLSLGADYKLAKNVKVFGYYTDLTADDVDDRSYLGFGMEYKF